MLLIKYEPKNDEIENVPDDMVLDRVEYWCTWYKSRSNLSKEYTIKVSQELLILGFRLAVKRHWILPTHIKIILNDQVCEIDSDGRMEYPDVFNSPLDNIFSEVLGI